MRIIVACESSGRVREAFRARGHEAYSCDLKPAEDSSDYHYEGDVFEFLKSPYTFDLMIAHPPCTFLCNSGVRWLYRDGKKDVDPATGDPLIDRQRWQNMHDGADFFLRLKKMALINNPKMKMAFENPIPHIYASSIIGRPDQYVQPWWFGDPAFKTTGLWLQGLPLLHPTNKLLPPKTGTAEHKAWSAIHRASPGPNRAEERSRTFPGFALAMASQWS